jgi:transposase InsO family protein
LVPDAADATDVTDAADAADVTGGISTFGSYIGTTSITVTIVVVSDHGMQFVCKFSRRLLELLDIQGNRSTAYHPESDGQTERVNQTLE